MKYRRVRGEARIMFTVDLPKKNAKTKVICDDPAKEAVIEALPQSLDLYLWGKNEAPLSVCFEIHEEDVEIEEEDEVRLDD
jgi:hypothetical protein